MKKSKAWFIKFPLDAYALGPINFDIPVPETIVRRFAREMDGAKRLPIDFQCWPTKQGGK